MPVVGTAGHVDHGKSTLIERISGRDPDRWAEEKRRGLTIDLGFAWTTLPNGTEVSFVDVPGHEKFLKNMLAGIEAIDVALFVVSAEEGWMPQSEEHLAVLDLLEVDRAVVALTKIDAVDEELGELAAAEVGERLEGTSLAGAPVVPVSALTGEGVDTLLAELAACLPGDRPGSDRPRMWVDRSFSVAGAGTIATGTLLDGRIAVETIVEIYPTGETARVRSIQSHEESHEGVDPWRRVAVNLSGIGPGEIVRGHMIGLPGQWETSRRFAATLGQARFVDEIDQRGAYQIHLGSSAHRVSITGIQDGRAILNLDEDVPMAVGDRFILRDTGRKLVVGGGRVLDPSPGRTRRALGESSTIDPGMAPDAIASRLLTIRGIDSLARLRAHSGGGEPSGAVVVGPTAVDDTVMVDLHSRAMVMVDEEHRSHPLRPGLPMATLAKRLEVQAPVVEALVDRSDQLERIGPDVARVGHSADLSEDQEAAWRQAVTRLGEGLAVPSEEDLDLDADVISLKLRAGELVRIAPGLVYLPEQVEQLERHMSELGEFTVAQFRDAAGLSRKYAVPILEWSDKEGLTVRRGDLRRFR
ncbi:MAG: selenocysteine-specific translation elongation factor [Acidimicrobiia bacterium]|jgi:selenocysteine-specific elongation factor